MIEKLSTVLQVDDLEEAVERWAVLLGVPPTFVDGERWAQFDAGGGRLALAGTDRVGGAGVMVKVSDLDAEHARLSAAGLAAEPIVSGGHERRFSVSLPTGTIAVFYAPR